MSISSRSPSPDSDDEDVRRAAGRKVRHPKRHGAPDRPRVATRRALAPDLTPRPLPVLPLPSGLHLVPLLNAEEEATASSATRLPPLPRTVALLSALPAIFGSLRSRLVAAEVGAAHALATGAAAGEEEECARLADECCALTRDLDGALCASEPLWRGDVGVRMAAALAGCAEQMVAAWRWTDERCAHLMPPPPHSHGTVSNAQGGGGSGAAGGEPGGAARRALRAVALTQLRVRALSVACLVYTSDAADDGLAG